MDETQVSDVYVRLGNDFNAAVTAFAGFNIDMAYVNDIRSCFFDGCVTFDTESS